MSHTPGGIRLLSEVGPEFRLATPAPGSGDHERR